MKRAIVSAMVAVALLVTGVTMTSFNGVLPTSLRESRFLMAYSHSY